MAVIHVTAAVRNPAEPDRVWEGVFLVDTGATDCLVPRPIWSRSACDRRDNGYTASPMAAPSPWMSPSAEWSSWAKS